MSDQNFKITNDLKKELKTRKPGKDAKLRDTAKKITKSRTGAPT